MHLHDTTTSKTCTRCQRTLPVTDFSLDRRAKSGLQARCKECNLAYRDAHKEHNADYFRTYHAKNREDRNAACKARYHAAPEKAQEYRAKNRERRNDQAHQWHDNHREHEAEYAKRYRVETRERRAQVWRKWYDANKGSAIERAKAATLVRRARKRNSGGVYTPEDVRAQYTRQRGKCYWCGKKVGKQFHVDHIIPLSRGGSNWPDNLVIACPHCNLSKGSKLPHEWEQSGRLL